MNKPEYRINMSFDMSCGSLTRRLNLTMVSKTPRRTLNQIRLFGYTSRGRFIPGSRLIEARFKKIEAF